MAFKIMNVDITKLEVDAIVNAANTDLIKGGGVCGAIFNAADDEDLVQACLKLAPIKTAWSVITPGFNLAAKHIIHTAGPIYKDYSPEESERLLVLAYQSALNLALENSCRSLAFPLISSGIYGYPKDQALAVAIQTIEDFLAEHEMEVILAVMDPEVLELLGDKLDEA